MSNAKIDIAQSALRDAWGVTGGPRADEFRPTGEVDGPMCPHRIYKLKGQTWSFKSEIPIGAESARALADYLAVLDAEAPDHVSEEFRRGDDDIERELGSVIAGGHRALGGRNALAFAGGLGVDESCLRDRALEMANHPDRPASEVVARAKTYFAFLKGD